MASTSQLSSVLESLASINPKCKECKGRCYDSNQSVRQANVRKFFGSPTIPDDCVDSEIDGTK